MWDFRIQTDHVLKARRPDLVLADKERICKIIGITVGRAQVQKTVLLRMARILRKVLEI